VPALQLVHALAPPAEYFPMAQAMHSVPAAFADEPALHGVQAVGPPVGSCTLIVPAEHFKHTPAEADENVPDAQVVQAAELAPEYFPALQLRQLVEAGALEYCPDVHCEQEEAPAPENDPATQEEQEPPAL